MTQSRYFATAAVHESKGDLALALSCMINAAKDPDRARMAPVVQANSRRLFELARRRAAAEYSGMKIDVVSESRHSPLTYTRDITGKNSLPPVISLTTISTRVNRVERTIESALAQRLSPHSINLFVSNEPFLLDEGIASNHPVLKRLASLGVNIYAVPNIGPYRKQYPVLKMLRQSGAPPDTPIITLDDDVIYPEDAIGALMDEAEREASVVAHRGRELHFDHSGRIKPYNLAAPPRRACCLRNLGTGKNGIVYRLKHFPRDAGDYVGPQLAPTADDIWCKWVTALNCIPTRIVSPNAIQSREHDFEETDPDDKTALWHNFNARGSNDIAIANIENFFAWARGSVVKLMVACHV